MTERRNYRYYDFVMAAFVTVLICSNLIGPAKIAQLELPLLGVVTFGAGVLFFPISYVFGDILTEVYGYSRARNVIWAGFAGLGFASFMSAVVVALPPASFWHHQADYEVAFGSTWRIVLASLLAFWAGEFCNSFVLAKMKVWTEGKSLYLRTIGSTIVGEGVDSMIFYPVAFFGIWSNTQLLTVMSTNYCIKVGWETLATPITYKVVAWLKRVENEDYYDRDTNFNPFTLQT
jgi:uncharacterized integral membrane protein (TIGR00697 family)